MRIRKELEDVIAANIGIASTLPELETALADYEALGRTGLEAQMQLDLHRGGLEVARKAAAAVAEARKQLDKSEEGH